MPLNGMLAIAHVDASFPSADRRQAACGLLVCSCHSLIVKINTPVLLLAVLALGLGLGHVARTYFDLDGARPSIDVGNYSHFYESSGSPVVLYSMSTCQDCNQARDLLQANNVAFAEKIVDRSQIARNEIKALKAERVPVLLIGRYKIEGYGKEEIMGAVRDNDTVRTLP